MTVRGASLRSGNTTSCGGCCARGVRLYDEALAVEYAAWRHGVMRAKSDGAPVHGPWTGPEGFRRFIAEVGTKPAANKVLRMDVPTKGFVPGNVRWADGRRRGRVLTAFGEQRSVTEWAELLGISVSTIYANLAKGLTDEQALCARRCGHV